MPESKYNLSNAKFGGGFAEGTQTGGTFNDYSTNNFINQNSENIEHNTADVKTVLVLAANPKTTSRLRLDEEVREIDARLQTARNREALNLEFDIKFNLQVRWAVRVRDVSQALLDIQPQIVHFCGHGVMMV